MRLEVAIANTEQIEQTVEAEAGDGLVCLLPHDGLGTVRDAHAREVEHGNVVGSIADRHYLLERDTFLFGDFSKERCFTRSVDDGRDDAAGDKAVANLEFIGMNVIDAKALLQRVCEEGEAAGKDSGLIAEKAQSADKTLGAIGERYGIHQACLRALRGVPSVERLDA